MKNKPITFVYICRPGENEELRYSIRSVLKFFPEAKIWVFGEPPEWYDGDYVKIKQDQDKYTNAYKNLQAIATANFLPKNIVIMNDDFYIIRKLDTIGYFYEGTLEDKDNLYYDSYPQSSYTRKITNTLARLKKRGVEVPLSYELHVPFPVDRTKLSRIASSGNYLWRSLYGNTFKVGGEKMEDVKVYNNTRMNFKNHDMKKSRSPFLSSDDKSFDSVKKEKLEKLFKDKTDLEKW